MLSQNLLHQKFVLRDVFGLTFLCLVMQQSLHSSFVIVLLWYFFLVIVCSDKTLEREPMIVLLTENLPWCNIHLSKSCQDFYSFSMNILNLYNFRIQKRIDYAKVMNHLKFGFSACWATSRLGFLVLFLSPFKRSHTCLLGILLFNYITLLILQLCNQKQFPHFILVWARTVDGEARF